MSRLARPYCWLRGHRDFAADMAFFGSMAQLEFIVTCARCGRRRRATGAEIVAMREESRAAVPS